MSERSRRRNNQGTGTKIFAGRYAYQKPLGRGAGGSVYLAEDLREDRREVALKVLSAEACETVQGKMLRREFEILSKLNHPNLVRVYDFGKLPDGGMFLAEEYIDGFSLQDARALLDPAALIGLSLQVLQGLAYLHAMGMIHRDIKPANVMLLWLDDAAARPMVKLVDFGLSSMDPKRDTLRGGTRSYMAPEVIRGEKGERRSDLYSLGVTLYYALCGVLPFGPRSKEDPPPTEEGFRPPEPHRLHPEVPLELSRFTMALLRQVPDVDYADAGEALQALAADAGTLIERSAGRMANSLDLAAPPVIRGYFERGILSRRIEEDDLLLEWLSMNDGPAMGQLYLIHGEEGVGKSRLLKDVQASTKLSDHLVLSLECDGEERPYALLLDMVEQIVALAKSHGVGAVEKYEIAICLRRLMTSLGVETPGENVAPMVEQAWMRSLIEEVVSNLAPNKVVFFIDDVHRGDEPSLEVLGEWFRSVKSQYRPDLVATTVKGDVYYRLARGKGVQVLPIEGVGTADVKAFFREQLGLVELSDDWLTQVAKASRGRPAYIEELCRYLIDSGMLRRESQTRWKARVSDIEAGGVPSSLRESLRRRVTSVGAAGRECLELLALLKRPVLWADARSLLRRGGSTSEEAERTLQTVDWRHLITTDLTTSGRFLQVVHPELLQVVADMLSPKWRRALHRRIGELIARRWQVGRGEALEAAEHLERGGRLSEAAPYFEIAADTAVAALRADEGKRSLVSALKGRRDVSARAMLQLKLARLSLSTFDPEGCREYLGEAIKRARSGGPDWLLFRVLLEAGEMELAMGNVEGAAGHLEVLAEVAPSLALASEAQRLAADVALRRGEFKEADRRLSRCIEGCADYAVSGTRALAMGAKAHIDFLQGRTEEALRKYQQALEWVDEVSDPLAKGRLLARYGADLRRMGSPMEARESLIAALPILAMRTAPDVFVEALFQYAWTLIDLGSSSTARRRANEAFRFAQLLGHEHYEKKIALLLGILLLRRREDREAAAGRVEEIARAFDRGEYFLIDRAEVLIALGEMMIGLRLTDGGPKYLQQGRQWAFQIGAQGLLPPVDD